MSSLSSTPASAGNRQRLGRRPATAVSVTPVTGEELDVLLRWNDDTNAVIVLARALELDTPELEACPSRLDFFHEALANSPALRVAVKNGTTGKILSAWLDYSRTQMSDPRHWHALLMLMRERMIAQPETWTAERTKNLTALWLVGFGSIAFWSYFGGAAAGVVLISPEEKHELFEWAVGEWLEGLKNSFSTAMTRQQQPEMIAALETMKLAEKDESQLREFLVQRGLPVALPADSTRYQFARDTVRCKLQELEDQAVQEAEVFLQVGPEKTPDLSAAIESLGRFMTVGGGSKRVLIKLMQWYLQPAEANLKGEGQPVRFDSTVKAVVEQLESKSVEGDSLQPENVLLANYHLVEAYRHHEIGAWDRCLSSAEAALRWNPGLYMAQFFYLRAHINLHKSRDSLVKLLEAGRQRGFSQDLLAQIEKITT